MDFQNYLAQIKREWEKFTATGMCDKNIIREEIVNSWTRCRNFGVDPKGGVCQEILVGAELEDLLEKNKDLIEVARPILHSIYEFLKGSGYYVMLANRDVYLLEFFGDHIMDKAAEEINFKTGACWKEEYVGTTVLGIMPHYRRPIQMAGAEHYCERSQEFTCSAAPIFDDAGNYQGLISISGPVIDMHKHTLGIVVAAAEAIQHSQTIKKKNNILEANNKYMRSILQTVGEAIIVYNENKKITYMNPAAKKISSKNVGEGASIYSIFPFDEKNRTFDAREFNNVESKVMADSGERSCIVSGFPLMGIGDMSGTVLVIKTIGSVQKLIRKYGSTQAYMHIEDIIGESNQIKKCIELAWKAANTDGNIILQGESGTGKEVFAQAIHNLSQRKDGPFIAVNCGAIPRDLVGSELFGYSEGSFTGAVRGGRAGKFELASSGTIFLDEIGDMPLEQQVNLLRVLQEHKLTRIGSSEEIAVDVRVIAASNKYLKDEIVKGTFREDLYYRLNVIPIEIPPLRERKEDIRLLFTHFVTAMTKGSGQSCKEIDPGIFKYLYRYNWPGNVRELQNTVERMLSICSNDSISIRDIPMEILLYEESAQECDKSLNANHQFNNFDVEKDGVSINVIRETAKKQEENKEVQIIKEILISCGGNVTKAAEKAGISRSSLYRKMRKYGIVER